MGDVYLTTKEVAEFFKQSESWVLHSWPTWIEFGVRPIRLNGHHKGRLIFKKSQLINMAEQWVVV